MWKKFHYGDENGFSFEAEETASFSSVAGVPQKTIDMTRCWWMFLLALPTTHSKSIVIVKNRLSIFCSRIYKIIVVVAVVAAAAMKLK